VGGIFLTHTVVTLISVGIDLAP